MSLLSDVILQAVDSKQESFDDYPEAASENAQQALDWRDEHGRDEVTGGTEVGWQRANQLANREPISRETVGRMAAFERHEDNAEIANKYEGEPWKDSGYVAWLLWGGDEGIEWAQEKLDELENETDQQAEGFGVDVYSIEQTDEGGPATPGSILGVAVDMPNAGVYVDWNIAAWPEDEQLSDAHVSDYATIEDLAQVTQGNLERVKSVSVGDVQDTDLKALTQKQDELEYLTFDTEEQAAFIADLLGCDGTHEHEGGYMPCESHEEITSMVEGDEDVVAFRGLSDEAVEYITSTYDVEVV